jgi:hypothetical protein
MRPYLKKPSTKIGLVEWLKVKVLNSSPSAAKKKKKERNKERKRKEKKSKEPVGTLCWYDPLLSAPRRWELPCLCPLRHRYPPGLLPEWRPSFLFPFFKLLELFF